MYVGVMQLVLMLLLMVPYNDAESQGTFWVNMPDFASSTESLQLQRGVGTSTNGSGAFGASLNILTDAASSEANGEIANSFGSYATRKHTVKFSTGLLNNHFELAGRVSCNCFRWIYRSCYIRSKIIFSTGGFYK